MFCLTFQTSRDHRSLLDNEVQGKRKKGGIWVDESTVLCEITCDDNSSYSICSCLRGRLIEVNTRLLEEPGLLNSKVYLKFNNLVNSLEQMDLSHCFFQRLQM